MKTVMAPFDTHRSMPAQARTSELPALRWLALLFSTGTLVCCALPILLVSLGLGVAFAALTSTFPVLVTLTEHKTWVFGFSSALIAAAGYSTFRPGRSCLADPALAAACERAHGLSVKVFWITLGIWGIGFVMAYLALPVRILLGN